MASLLRRLPFALLSALFLISSGAKAAAPEPVVEGHRIIDSLTSARFVPHGVNFPGYEYSCQQGWSYGEDGTEPEDIDSTVAAIASWKINTVRLPLNQDCWLGDDGLPTGGLTVNGYRQSVEDFVDALNAAGIVAIVDLHWSGPNGVIADGLRPMPDNRSAAFWSSVATRFRDYPSVIFDLFNEPHSRWNADDTKVFTLGWDCWANGGCYAPVEPDTAATSGHKWYRTTGLATLTEVVRNAGATQPIILSGIDYANDLRGWLANAPDDDQLIAGFHNYPEQRCRTTACWNKEIAPLNEKVPVLAAEFGQNGCDRNGHVNRFMDWADDHVIGYLAWAWWSLPDLGCHNFALVSDLDGTPLGAVGNALHDHLATLPAVLPEPPVRVSPGLTIKKAKWKRPNLRLRIGISRKASKKAQVRVRLARDRKSSAGPRTTRRLLRRTIVVKSGAGSLNLRIPSGLKPVRVVVYYPGDDLLLPKTVSRKPASVSKITR
ncbi:MAG: cellulase family glycosylhydrolase [Solirubrobacterales bacterium]|nr:cellulase family glycosylhydrolase [Solirubrobacterales bacterium]